MIVSGAAVGVKVKRWSIIKWIGDPPPAGPIDRVPFEIIVGGDERPTLKLHPGDAGWDPEWELERSRNGWELTGNATH